MKPVISFDEFRKLDIRVGLVENCEPKEKSEKLLRLTVDFGQEGKRNILSGIAKWYKPESIIGKLLIFIINLEPRNIMEEESQGMLLAANGTKPVPLKPQTKTAPGAAIR